jgi:hypothetical protein
MDDYGVCADRADAAAGSGLHDGSDAGAGTDLRSRPSTRTPSWAKCPTGGVSATFADRDATMNGTALVGSSSQRFSATLPRLADND